MTVLVTGGAGFIGSHLVDALLGAGRPVRVLDNLATGSRENLAHVAAEIDFHEADLRDVAAVEAAVSSCEAVVHLGALGSVPRSVDDPRTSQAVNVDGTLNVLLAARDHDVGRVLLSSSSSVYGRDPRLPKTEEMTGPTVSPYALTKLAGEEYLRLFHELYGLDTVRVRFFNVFGPRQTAEHVYAAVIPKFIAAALQGEPLEVHGDGLQSRDFTYVDNVVNGLLAALDAPAERVTGRAFNLACGESTSLLRVIELLEGLHDGPITSRHQPARPGDIRHSLADNTAAREAFGYEATIDVAEGVRRTWRWAADGDT